MVSYSLIHPVNLGKQLLVCRLSESLHLHLKFLKIKITMKKKTNVDKLSEIELNTGTVLQTEWPRLLLIYILLDYN